MLPSSFDLLKKSYALFRTNLWFLVGYTAWLLLPAAGYFFANTFLTNEEALWFSNLVIGMVDLGIMLWLMVVIFRVSSTLIQNKKMDPEAITKDVWALVVPLVLVIILQSFLVLLGFIAFVIPGVILMVWLAFSQQAVILDGKKPIEALKFSRALSKNRFWAVLSRLLIGPIMIVLVYAIVIGVIVSILGLFAGFSPNELLTMKELPPWMELFISVVDIFMIPLVNMYLVMLYEELKAKVVESKSQKVVE